MQFYRGFEYHLKPSSRLAPGLVIIVLVGGGGEITLLRLPRKTGTQVFRKIHSIHRFEQVTSLLNGKKRRAWPEHEQEAHLAFQVQKPTTDISIR